MSQNALVALLAWPVVSLVLFATLRPWRAALATFLGAYVLLPTYALMPLPGLPDYSKYTAPGLGAVLGVLLFDARRLAAFRPRWYDLPALVLCLEPGVSFVANGLPSWQGVTAVANLVLPWGVPYFIGRLYADQPGAVRDLVLALVLAGAATTTLIAFEVFTQRSLNGILYGRAVSNGSKYGIYSPVVFAANQLEIAHWTSLTALSAFALWCTRAGPSLLGRPIGGWAAVAVSGVLLCHQTAAAGLTAMMMFVIASTAGRPRLGKLPESAALGAVLLLAPKLGGRLTLTALLGLGLFRYLRDRHPQLIAWALIVAAPLYITVRITDVVSRDTLTVAAYTLLGAARGRSLEFRIMTEEHMVAHTMQRPIFGWGTFLGGRGWDDDVVIVDSAWIIHFARYGIAGLAALYGVLALAQGRAVRRYPITGWSDPRNVPAGALILCLSISALDGLLNAYQTIPVVPLAIGLLVALPAGRAAGAGRAEAPADRQLDRVDRLLAIGRLVEAEAACRLLVDARSANPAGRGPLADACDRLADLREAAGRLAEAEPSRRRALELRAALLAEAPSDPAARLAMAGCCERLARNLASRGRSAPAVAARTRALELRAALLADDPDNPDARHGYADGLNDLAWLLAVAAAPADRDPRRAAAMAEHAVRFDPGRKAYWNTLGAAYVAAGDHGPAVAALNRSLHWGPDADGFDDALLALAFAGLGDPAAAGDALARLDARLAARHDAPGALLRLRAEAAEALRALAPAGAS